MAEGKSTRSAQVKRKQFLLLGGLVGGILAIAIVASLWITPSKRPAAVTEQAKSRSIAFGGGNSEAESWRAQSSSALSEMQRRLTATESTNQQNTTELAQVKDKNRDLEAKVAELSRNPPGGTTPGSGSPIAPPGPPVPPGAMPFRQQGTGATPPPPPYPMNGASSPALGTPSGPPSAPAPRIISVALEEPAAAGASTTGTAGTNGAQQFGQNAANRRGAQAGAVGNDGKERFSDDDPLAYNRAGGRSAKTYLPAGTFAKAVTINGLDAPTGGQAQQNPGPVLLRVQDNAQLPNEFRANLKSCMITANAHGDLSSERAYIRLDRLSCIDDNGGAIDVAVRGYVSGEDGKTGLRGRLVSKSGQVIANALFTGVLAGLGQGLQQSASTTNTSALTGVQTADVKNPWTYGIGAGMSRSMDRIVQYYMKLADKLFPVVEVDAGRTVDIVITRGVTIERQ